MKRLIRKAEGYDYNPSKIVEESDYKANQLIVDFAQTTLPDEVTALQTLVDYFTQMEKAVKEKLGESHAKKIGELTSSASECLKYITSLQKYYDSKKDYITNITDGLVAKKRGKKVMAANYLFSVSEVEAIINHHYRRQRPNWSYILFTV